ncbi:MAG: hypothetical protein V1724_04330 [Chloroflexota bacterium]
MIKEVSKRPVYMVSGGITKFKKAYPDKDFRHVRRPGAYHGHD